MKKLLSLATIAVLTTGLTGCFENETDPRYNTGWTGESLNECGSLTTEGLSEDRGCNDFTLPENIEKIVTTVPSNTEVLLELGVVDMLVGADENSAGIEGLPADLPLIPTWPTINAEQVVELAPDILLASSHIEDDADYAALEAAGIVVVVMPTSSSIGDIYDDIEFIGELVGEEDKAKEIVEGLEDDVAEINEIATAISYEDKKTVFMEIGGYGGTLYSTGQETFINDMINLVGGANVYKGKEQWPGLNSETVVAMNPDVIIANGTYWADADKTIFETIKTREGFNAINAVIKDEVHLIDGNSSSRPSHNFIKAARQIAEALYPELYDFA